jgi:hypothetical protein
MIVKNGTSVFRIIFAVGNDYVPPANTNSATLQESCTERNVKQSYGSLPENLNAIKPRRKKNANSFWQHLNL